MTKPTVLRRLILPLAAAALIVPGAAHAQFSPAFKFLEAVKKKDGEEVMDTLNQPGSTIVNTREAVTGQTALHIVTARRDRTWMEFLIAKGANVNLRDAQGQSPLDIAANLGFVEGVELLIANHARLDDANNAGETPLIIAVHHHDEPMIRLLLRAGADPDRADNSGRSALDYAKLQGGALESEIATNAQPKGQRGGSATYGPSF